MNGDSSRQSACPHDPPQPRAGGGPDAASAAAGAAVGAPQMRTVRDPVWQNIRVGPVAAAIVDTPEFQRLRRVKQLGFAHLVYPGAVHTRFMHALGVYHLTSRAIDILQRIGDLDCLTEAHRQELPIVRLAALLHDVGHYAFSHAMEEVGPDAIPGHHEEMASRFLGAGPIRRTLTGLGPGAHTRIEQLIRGESDHPLQGLVAGSLDLDKIDYLRRDSFFYGVPYGAVDVERLLDALTVIPENEEGLPELGVTEKGVSALESLLFSKYQMFRNVYWHHGVRAATAAFRRLIETAQTVDLLRKDELAGLTDEELLNLLAIRREAGHGNEAGSTPAGPIVPQLLDALTNRRLPKRVVEMFGDALPPGIAAWTRDRPGLVHALEERLAVEWGLPPGTVMLDYPAYPEMLELRLLLLRGSGEVQRLTSAGEEGLIDLPRLSQSLHHAARVFRVFTLDRTTAKDPRPLLDLLESSGDEVARRLEESRALY